MAKEKQSEFGEPTNDRGFLGYGGFIDAHGNKVRLVESSADPLVYAHIFCGERDAEAMANGKFLQPSPHLNVRQAMKLIAALTKFVEHKLATSHDEPLTEE
jgi:hypothetical protein